MPRLCARPGDRPFIGADEARKYSRPAGDETPGPDLETEPDYFSNFPARDPGGASLSGHAFSS